MKYSTLPGVDKPISRLVQGTATDMDTSDPDACFALLDMALAHGINTFDQAHIYGAALSQILGRWMQERGVRDQVVILAKGAHQSSRPRVTPEDITADLHDALTWLQTERVEMYVLHRDNPAVPVGPIVETLNALHSEGKIGAFGGSNWSVARLQEANDYAQAHGLLPFAVSSPNFSLAAQREPPWADCLTISGPAHEADRAWYAQSGMALFPWSSLAGGFFSERFRRDNLDAMAQQGGFAEVAVRCYCDEPNFQRLDRARALAAQKGGTVPQIALAFVLCQPLNIFPLISCANEAMFDANVGALDITLTPQEMAYLDLKADTLA